MPLSLPLRSKEEQKRIETIVLEELKKRECDIVLALDEVWTSETLTLATAGERHNGVPHYLLIEFTTTYSFRDGYPETKAQAQEWKLVLRRNWSEYFR